MGSLPAGVPLLTPVPRFRRMIPADGMYSPRLRTRRRSPQVTIEHRAIKIDARSRLLMASAMVIALVAARPASAASLSTAQATGVTSHVCKCGTKCRGDSCCCGPRKAQNTLSAPEPVPDLDADADADADDNPCFVNPAPCGEPGLPGASYEGPVGKCAALACVIESRCETAGALLPFATQDLLPTPLPSRLDRPPEHLVRV